MAFVSDPAHRKVFRLALVLLAAMAAASLAAPGRREEPPPADPPRKIAFEAGKEVQVADTALVDGHFILYVPKEYTPDRQWPVIYCYHGVNQAAKVWPFKELTEGRGFIVVGMSYVKKNGAGLEEEWQSLKRIGELVAGTLNVNRKMIFIGGFSLGGGWTYMLSGRDPTHFAGIVALGMSGHPGRGGAEAYTGKPVCIAHGENDQYCKNISQTVEAFKAVGAVVTHEVFAGQGHAVDTRNAVIRKWLRDNGPLKAVKASLDAAAAAEKAGQLGPALSAYQAIARDASAGEHAKTADVAAKAILEAAEKKFAAAEDAVKAKQYGPACKLLAAIEKTYAGCSLADRAKHRINAIQTDPAIKAEVEQARIDAAAEALEAQARAFEKSREFARAIAVYDKCIADYPAARHVPQMKARRDALKADKTIQAGIVDRQMENDCKSWLSMAEAYLSNGDTAKARTYLKRIVDTYPASPQAQAARKKLESIP